MLGEGGFDENMKSDRCALSEGGYKLTHTNGDWVCAQSKAVMEKKGEGDHCVEFEIKVGAGNVNCSDILVGVAKTYLGNHGFDHWPGVKEGSFFLSLYSGSLFCKEERGKAYFDKKILPRSTIIVGFDMKNGALSFIINGKDMGIAFQREQFKTGQWHLTVSTWHANDTLEITKPPV
jgi:hypothetical protein